MVIVTLYAQQDQYIEQYHSDITIHSDKEMSKSETIRYVHKAKPNGRYGYADDQGTNISSKTPLFTIDLPSQKYLYDFEVVLNGKEIEWIKTDTPSKLILRSTYQPDAHYHYTIHYKETLIPHYLDANTDKVEWDLFNHSLQKVKQFEAHIHLPEALTKTNVQLHFRYGNPLVQWIDERHMMLTLNDVYTHNLIMTLSFPSGLMGKTTNPALIKKESKPFVESANIDSLIYWQLVLLLIYLVFLYYYARHYGSFAAMGSIPVRYRPPKGVSLLQSGFIIDEKNDGRDFTAAIIELASLGYLKIKSMDPAYAKALTYLEKIDKKPDTLTADQQYLLERILFLKNSATKLSSAKHTFFQKFGSLERQIRDTLKQAGLMHFDIIRAQRAFLIKAFLTALPLFAFFTYTTFLIYGPDFTEMMVLFMLFFILYVIIGSFTRQKSSFDGAYAIYFMLLIPFVIKAGSLKVLLAGPMLALPVITALILYFDSKISWLTGKGLKSYKALLGYKEFVTRTELPKLTHLLKHHPDHIEESLSYALLFRLMTYKLI
jgi:hypothetical protein